MKPTLKIGEWQVDPIDGQIRRDDEIRRLRPKAMGVLCCLAETPGELVTRDTIIDNVWGRQLISDEPLTTCIAELRRGLDDSATSPRFIQTVPKRGYLLVAEVTLLADEENTLATATLTAAATGAQGDPAEALTPQLAATGQTRSATTPKLPQLLWVVGIVVAALVLILYWNPQLVGPGLTTTPPPTHAAPQAAQPRPVPTIAVFPFLNLTPDPANDYFGDGLAEEILNSLTHIEGLRVRSRTSSFALKNQNLGARQIAQRLQVTHILEGSVRRNGDRLRISAQLIDVNTDTHIWSEVFEKQLAHSFEIQGEIATRVSDSLELALDLEAQRKLADVGTTNMAAYNLYLQGRQLIALRSSSSVISAIDVFTKALTLDSNYAQAYLGLADANLLAPLYNDYPGANYFEKALTAVETALRLSPDYGEAYATLGAIHEELGQFVAAETAFKVALERAPRYPTTYHWYGFMLYTTARQEEADQMLRLAIAQDPLSHLISYALSGNLVAMGRIDEAETHYRATIAADPTFFWAYEGMGELNWNGRGDLAAAARWYRKASDFDPNSTYFKSLLGAIYLDNSQPELAQQWISSASDLRPDSFLVLTHRALLALYRGQADESAALAKQVLKGEPRNYLAAMMARNHNLAAGDFDAAQAHYTHAYPELLAKPLQLDVGNFQAAVDLALVLLLSGDRELADTLLTAAWPIAQQYPRHGLPYRLSDVKILALQGRQPEAIALLSQAIESGWRPYWWLHIEHDPALASLHDQPGYADLLTLLRPH
jgi:TolB-like protein/DNA-binding winged helix-turn-helix (wHTH) protein/Tfp pilus assembly protein PilF